MNLKEFKTRKGEILLYNGSPDLHLLDELSEGPGDLWHTSLDQGYTGIFPELKYQIAVFWWFLNDFNQLPKSINWRINPNAFVIRKRVWEIFGGFPDDYKSGTMKALDFGFRLLRYGGGVPMYIRGLYVQETNDVLIPSFDRYIFFLKNFKNEHAYNMLFKEGLRNPLKEFKSFKDAKNKASKNSTPIVPVRQLKKINGTPKVSVIIPTMFRQEYTLQLLKDYEEQEYPVTEVIVIDATPIESRDEKIYQGTNFSFKLNVNWQVSQGSCRARNEAIKLCSGDYIIFGDDDTRILPDFVKNHISFLQTYKADACNGLDIRADNHKQGREDLKRMLKTFGESLWKAGAAQTFSNANSCVKKEWVDALIGNDINFDGGYGEDSDFGFTLLKRGAIVLFNPFSANLHLKPPAGGYRHWGQQSAVLGKERKKQAWELDQPVKFIKPVPSPTVVYGILKHFKPAQVKEYRSKYFLLYLFRSSKSSFPLRLIKMPYKILQFRRSMYYAKNLLKLGPRYE